MRIEYIEGGADLFADEGKDLFRSVDQLRAKRVSTPIGEEVDWIEVDELIEGENNDNN